MRLEEIKAIARERGIRISGMKKKELIDMILMTESSSNEEQEKSSDSSGLTICQWYEEYQL